MSTVTYSSDSSGVSGTCIATWTGDGAALELLPGFKPRMIRLMNITDSIEHISGEGFTSTLGTLERILNGTAQMLTQANGITIPATKSATANGITGTLVAAGLNVNAKVYVCELLR